MNNLMWAIRLDTKGIDHLYRPDNDEILTTMCGLVLNGGEDWFPSRVNPQRTIKPIKMCQVCLTNKALVEIIEELGE